MIYIKKQEVFVFFCCYALLDVGKKHSVILGGDNADRMSCFPLSSSLREAEPTEGSILRTKMPWILHMRSE